MVTVRLWLDAAVDRIAKHLAAWLLRSEPDPELFEIYTFVLAALLQSGAVYGTILIFAAYTHAFLEALAWIGFFLAGRNWAGGSHAPTRTVCYVISVTVALSSLMLAQLLPASTLLTSCITLVSVVLVFVAAPTDVLPVTTKKSLRRRKVLARAESIAAAVTTMLFAQACWDSVAYAACLASFSAAISCLVAWRRESHETNVQASS